MPSIIISRLSFLLLLSFSFSSYAYSEEKTKPSKNSILTFPSNDFRFAIKKISQKSNLVVHYTSTDKKCSHCINNNKQITKSQKKLKDDFIFAQVVFNPWRQYLKKHKSYLKGLPETHIFYKGMLLARLSGYRKNLSKDIAKEFNSRKILFDAPAPRIDIDTVTSDQLRGYIAAQKPKTRTFVHITSTSSNCIACIQNNKFFRQAAGKHNNHYNFVELVYNPYKLVSKDKKLTTILGKKVGGLPITYLYDDGKKLGAHNGIWPDMTTDLEKLKSR